MHLGLKVGLGVALRLHKLNEIFPQRMFRYVQLIELMAQSRLVACCSNRLCTHTQRERVADTHTLICKKETWPGEAGQGNLEGKFMLQL